jgi:2-polyprenyl-6-methoxyphenol hydroxylase-like FAD-dependent oxidoreductase
MPPSDTQVLIVGAGPTGLVLALWLNHRGVRVRIVDKKTELEPTSRALVVHARTLEFYRQLGIADQVVAQGLKFAVANLWVKARRAGRVGFGDMGQGLSPYPFALIFPQDLHERLLIECLAERGVHVERPTELVDFVDDGGHVMAQLRRADGSIEQCGALYLAGCDGARSKTREVLGAGFPGSTYAHLFYVADIEGTGPAVNGELNLALDEADFVGVFPLPGRGRARLIGIVRPEDHKQHPTENVAEQISWNDVRKEAIQLLNLQIERINWFSTYHVHHRVANFFRRGRAFLLGDAAHIHSPVGGQGMNTGIGDAANLAWKLAAVIEGRCNETILDSYEPERVAFARRLVATTDRAFTVVTSTGRLANVLRVVVAPRLLPLAFKSKTVRRFMFRTVSQIAINYRESPLSQGRAGHVQAGDRLPWVDASAQMENPPAVVRDNFEPLASLDWQAHIYGDASSAMVDACSQLGLPLHTFPWSSTAGRAGLRRGALYVIRPDGYIGLAESDADPARLAAYLGKVAGCRPAPRND